VEPTTVVEVQVNTAFEHGRWRHPPAFVRHRPDLSVYDVPTHTATETPGNRGAWLLRRDEGERTEFIALSLWDSEDAIRAFAGDDIEAAVLCPEGERYLIGGESTVIHYDVAGEAIP
jgi:heme-degrading monooxygenase HmoA